MMISNLKNPLVSMSYTKIFKRCKVWGNVVILIVPQLVCIALSCQSGVVTRYGRTGLQPIPSDCHAQLLHVQDDVELCETTNALQSQEVELVLVQCWASVVDGGPTLNQHRACCNTTMSNLHAKIVFCFCWTKCTWFSIQGVTWTWWSEQLITTVM